MAELRVKRVTFTLAAPVCVLMPRHASLIHFLNLIAQGFAPKLDRTLLHVIRAEFNSEIGHLHLESLF